MRTFTKPQRRILGLIAYMQQTPQNGKSTLARLEVLYRMQHRRTYPMNMLKVLHARGAISTRGGEVWLTDVGRAQALGTLSISGTCGVV